MNLFWSYYGRESSAIVVTGRTELQVLIVFCAGRTREKRKREKKKSRRDMSDFIKSRGDAP